MSMSRITVILAALSTFSLFAPGVYAQHELHHVPPVINPDGYNPDFLHPFVEPLAFDPDYQYFAPADFDTYGGYFQGNTGWFATYDRVRIWVTRPDHEMSHTDGDFTWGNRFDVGYMTDEEHGWLFCAWNINGPNAVDILDQERINIYEEDDQVNGDPENTIDLRGGGGAGDDDEILTGVPDWDRNEPTLGFRAYRLQDTINVGDMASFELNKTVRWEPRHYGSVIEPFVGLRFVKFVDITQNDTYARFDEETGLIVVPPVLQDVALIDNASIEQMNTLQHAWTNHMWGGQLGLRWFKQKARWNLSGELRAFAFLNVQQYRLTDILETTYYDGTGAGDDVTYRFLERTNFNNNDSEFVFGTEIRAEAAYAISRDISLRGGVSIYEFGRGIARGPIFGDNSQDLTMVGFTFGAMINR
jgi:hypothetical protein